MSLPEPVEPEPLNRPLVVEIDRNYIENFIDYAEGFAREMVEDRENVARGEANRNAHSAEIQFIREESNRIIQGLDEYLASMEHSREFLLEMINMIQARRNQIRNGNALAPPAGEAQIQAIQERAVEEPPSSTRSAQQLRNTARSAENGTPGSIKQEELEKDEDGQPGPSNRITVNRDEPMNTNE
ncbi:unnamed protein product [Caenorhabditis sp. 36 PRJEB53466]|nr:unnamed protein product [Caenorhabditis sp. 36 PRJEB53466]